VIRIKHFTWLCHL